MIGPGELDLRPLSPRRSQLGSPIGVLEKCTERPSPARHVSFRDDLPGIANDIGIYPNRYRLRKPHSPSPRSTSCRTVPSSEKWFDWEQPGHPSPRRTEGHDRAGRRSGSSRTHPAAAKPMAAVRPPAFRRPERAARQGGAQASSAAVKTRRPSRGRIARGNQPRRPLSGQPSKTA